MIEFFDQNHNKLESGELKDRFSDELSMLEGLEGDARFEIQGDRLALLNEYGTPVFIDIEGVLQYHHKFFKTTSIKNQPLARALSLKKEKDLLILDATGGFLSDTLLMYAMGAKIEVYERNPLVQALIFNALKVHKPQNIEFFPTSILERKDFSNIDVIFFDPMYQVTNQKSLPKKEMQVFRDFVGKDEDANETFLYLRSINKRLVAKRSIKGIPFGKPDHTIFGKSTAYDVYLTR